MLLVRIQVFKRKEQIYEHFEPSFPWSHTISIVGVTEIKAHGNVCIQYLNFSLNEQWFFSLFGNVSNNAQYSTGMAYAL